jgi:hypothetical protein
LEGLKMSFRSLEDAVIGITNTIFGTPATYTPISGDPVEINGVFDNAYIESQGVSSLKPVLRIRLSDLAASPAKGDQVTVSSTTYRVLSSENDSYGAALLILQKV